MSGLCERIGDTRYMYVVVSGEQREEGPRNGSDNTLK